MIATVFPINPIFNELVGPRWEQPPFTLGERPLALIDDDEEIFDADDEEDEEFDEEFDDDFDDDFDEEFDDEFDEEDDDDDDDDDFYYDDDDD